MAMQLYTPQYPKWARGEIVQTEDPGTLGGLAGVLGAGLQGWREGREARRQRTIEDETRRQQSERNAMLNQLTQAQIDQIKADVQDPNGVIRQLQRQGFTPQESDEILRIRYGLKPRAGSVATKTPEQQLSFWSDIYRRATYDPVWGERVGGLAEVGDIAQQRVNELTKQLKNGPPAQPPGGQTIAPPAPGPGPKYPKLSARWPALSPDERQEVTAAIGAGMTDEEILEYFQ